MSDNRRTPPIDSGTSSGRDTGYGRKAVALLSLGFVLVGRKLLLGKTLDLEQGITH